MKTIKLLWFLVLFVAIAMGLVAERSGYAGGGETKGVNIRITLKNPTPYMAKVVMTSVDAMMQPHRSEERLIGSGGSHYWDCQATFPDHLSGKIYNPDKKQWMKLKSWCLLANHATEYMMCAPGLGTTTTWAICPYYAAQNSTSPFEYSHGFCKQ